MPHADGAHSESFHGQQHFLLEVEHITDQIHSVVGGFSKLSGMESHTEVIEYKPGNDLYVRRIPGRTYYNNIVLERGFTCNDDLYNWRLEIAQGSRVRRSGSVIVLDHSHAEVSRYNFYDAWPVMWKAPEMDATGSDTAIEQLELSVEYIEFVRAPRR
ncbi:MAG: phage tail-like protein [Myxococcota bacterium]|jgi:phage tail-like protein